MAHDDDSPPQQPAPRKTTSLFARILLLAVVITGLLVTVQQWTSRTTSYPRSRHVLDPQAHSFRDPQVRKYNFVLGQRLDAPDGVEKRVFTVNGLFPGPTIEVRSGDILQVDVENQLEEETSLHWHGLRHEHGSNSQDGSIGVTQCAIPPNGTHTYRFQIADTQSGTFWYHSHHAAQRADGLFGALIVHPPAGRDSSIEHDDLRVRMHRRTPDVEELVLLVGDWYHRTGVETLGWYRSPRSRAQEPVPDNALINGKQVYKCEKSIRKIKCDPEKGTRPRYALDPTKRHRLRLINTGSLAVIHFSIDNHLLTVIEADGTNIEPVTTKELPVAPGQRYSVIIEPVDGGFTDQSFWMRTRLDQSCFNYPNRALDPEPLGVLSYSRTSGLDLPSTSKWIIDPAEEFNALTLRSSDPAAHVLPEAEDVVVLYVNTEERRSNGGIPTAYVNQTSWQPDPYNPMLLRDLSQIGTGPLNMREFVVTTPRNRSAVFDIIVNNLEQGTHPFHLHGHSFWPLYTYSARFGRGSYRFDYPPDLPTTAPALRDTFVIPPYGHAIFRVNFDTPGEWLFHCHVLVHLASGMAINFNVRSDDIPPHERLEALRSCGRREELSL